MAAQERAANLHLYGRVANPIRGSLIGQVGHLDNDGLPFLLFVASHPPQALVDLFGEVNLQHGTSAQLFDERIKTSLVKIGRLTGQYRRHSHNTGERGRNRSFDRKTNFRGAQACALRSGVKLRRFNQVTIRNFRLHRVLPLNEPILLKYNTQP